MECGCCILEQDQVTIGKEYRVVDIVHKINRNNLVLGFMLRRVGFQPFLIMK